MKPDVETMENRATDDAILDLEDDPHRAALELNPEKPERLTWSTILAVGVSVSRRIHPNNVLTLATGSWAFICSSNIVRLPSRYSYTRPDRHGSR